MSPFDAGDATLFAIDPASDGVIRLGASSWTRRVLVSRGVEYVDMTSGVSMRVTSVQFPRVGSLRASATVTIGSVVYTLVKRMADDGYTETWATE